jgi:hypothetical protein
MSPENTMVVLVLMHKKRVGTNMPIPPISGLRKEVAPLPINHI